MAVHPLKGPFTVDDYHRLGELGILHEDDRVELIDGQVVEMTPIGPRHGGCVKQLARLLYRCAGDAVILGIQDPLILGRHAEPQPDIAVLKPRPEGYRTRHPTANDVMLVIEVADTSVAYDSSVKIPLYAAAGVPEAWLVDLRSERIAAYRNPTGGSYAEVKSLSRGTTITALKLPQVTLSVDQILG